MQMTETRVLPAARKWRLLVLVGLLAIGLGIRLYRITAPPVDFHPTRQFRSAIFARGFYFELLPPVDDWRRDIAVRNFNNLGLQEPQIVEYSAALTFLVTGGEHLWIPRALSALWWVLGAILVYRLGERLYGPEPAAFSMAFYLFAPFGVAASRSFQADPLMILMLLAGLYLFVLTIEGATPPIGTIAGAAASGVAVLIKPIAALFLFGGIAGYLVQRMEWRAMLRPLSLIFAALSVLPAVAYYAYVLSTTTFLRGQTAIHFMPELLLDKLFWSGWFVMVGRVAGYVPFLTAMLGLFLLREGRGRVLLGGMLGGYVVFGLMFSYVASTHDYYSLVLIPIVALGLGVPGAMVIERLAARYTRDSWRGVFLLIVGGLAAIISLISVKYNVAYRIYDAASENIAEIAPEIGERVNHSTNTVFLAEAYGLPLMYYGELSGIAWPHGFDLRLESLLEMPQVSAEERLYDLIVDNVPEFFIVTDLAEFNAQRDLREYLYETYPVLVETPDYIIFVLNAVAGS